MQVHSLKFLRSGRFMTGALLLALICSLSFFTATKAHAQDDAYVSYNDFYENLAPYGQWIEDPQYGYVWMPDVDGSFRPYYTNGNWAMTDYGNTWVSDYSWGWACFHYGRWTYDPYYGWLWIPGSHWGPAWVSWRYGGGYYGWAPLGPGYEFGGAYADYGCPNDWWVFIPPQYMYGGNYYRYWYGPRGNASIITNTTFINNTYVTNNVTYVGGPSVKQVEETTHQPVQIFKMTRSNNLNTRVHNNNIRMYRPTEIRPVANTGNQRITPPNVINAPQPIRTQQSVNTGQSTPRTFRDDVPKQTNHNDQVGTNISQTATPSPRQQRDLQPYEWDTRRSVPQDQPVRQPPQQQQPVRTQPQQQQPVRQQPQPQQPRAQPQQPRSALAPARSQPQQSGGRR